MTLQAAENSQRMQIPSRTPRLRLKPKAPRIGYVDGAWWPRGDDLRAELPDLLAVLSVRLGHVERVLYRLSDWRSAPRKLDTGGGQVRLDGDERQPISTISLLGPGFHKVDLLVVAVHADASDAHATMLRAAHPATRPVWTGFSASIRAFESPWTGSALPSSAGNLRCRNHAVHNRTPNR
jgi:hypothetical protein